MRCAKFDLTIRPLRHKNVIEPLCPPPNIGLLWMPRQYSDGGRKAVGSSGPPPGGLALPNTRSLKERVGALTRCDHASAHAGTLGHSIAISKQVCVCHGEEVGRFSKSCIINCLSQTRAPKLASRSGHATGTQNPGDDTESLVFSMAESR